VIGGRFGVPGEREQGERRAAGNHVEDTLEAEDRHDAQTIPQHAGECLPHQECATPVCGPFAGGRARGAVRPSGGERQQRPQPWRRRAVISRAGARGRALLSSVLRRRPSRAVRRLLAADPVSQPVGEAIRRHLLASQDHKAARRASSKERLAAAYKALEKARTELIACAATVRAIRDTLR
jgi:hypothetical protein